LSKRSKVPLLSYAEPCYVNEACMLESKREARR
jgi:hypothetical protein